MRNILLVAKREYLEQVRGRAFRLSTILVPVLFGVILGIFYFAGRNAIGAKHIVVASNDAALATAVRNQVQEHNQANSVTEVLAPASASDRAALVDRVRSKSLDGFFWIDIEAGQPPKAVYESQASGDIITASKLESALNHAVIRQRLIANGTSASSVESLLKDVDVETLQIDKSGKEVQSNSVTSFFKGYMMAILLFMTTLLYGMNVARSIIQEKTSRIFEVMLASVKASDLLAGKLIGTGAVGLTQLGIWIAFGAAALTYPAAVAVLSGKISLHFSPLEGILFLIYFLLGYLLYASLFSGLAASCETEQELQMYTPLAILPFYLSIALITLVTSNPNSAISIAASLFPFTSPIIMMLRLGSQPPPIWQLAASIAILALSVWGVLLFSSRLYRVGILMYGKRATLPELLRWLRYS
jgi:ABC-2 type transport system permease protein